MHQHGKTDFVVVFERGAGLQGHHDVHTGIDFRMVARVLRYPEEGVDFGKKPRQYAAFAQTGKKHGRIVFVERA